MPLLRRVTERGVGFMLRHRVVPTVREWGWRTWIATYHLAPELALKIRVTGPVHLERDAASELSIGARSTLQARARLCATRRASGEPPAQLTLGRACNIKEDSRIEVRSGIAQIGDRVALGRRSEIIVGNAQLVIGNCVRIAANVLITTNNHRADRLDLPIVDQGTVSTDVTIEDDVWIGAGAVILPGVTIGRGTIVGAGAVVTKDLPAAVIAGGVPARVLRSRGPQEPPPEEEDG